MHPDGLSRIAFQFFLNGTIGDAVFTQYKWLSERNNSSIFGYIRWKKKHIKWNLLNYTSASTETQTLTVVVEDNFGKSYEMEFSFNDTDEEEEFARSANKLGSV